MREDLIHYFEDKNSGTSKTKNEEFEKNGWLFVPNLINSQELICDVPDIRGNIFFHGSMYDFHHEGDEGQVEGSLSRYNYPPYKKIHYEVKRKLENLIGKELYPTYYYERFYFPGQGLPPHVDRGSCEISVSVHIGTNLKDPWPFWIKSCDELGKNNDTIKHGDIMKVRTSSGDGIIYKGCERPHWRQPMPGVKRNKVRKMFGNKELYYHQVFFHYVLANGIRSHFAWDMTEIAENMVNIPNSTSN
jgi:hypothetical protein